MGVARMFKYLAYLLEDGTRGGGGINGFWGG